jgi:glutamate-1-semialdehyde 2,1-aminomutase
MLSPDGPVYQAGTLSGTPVATAAGLTTLRLATDEVYATVDRAAGIVAGAATEALTAAGVPHVLQANGNMFSVFFTPDGVTSVREFDVAASQDAAAYAVFFHSMLDQGVYLPPSGYEAWFLSSAHDDAALDQIASALPAAAEAAARVQRGDS